MIKRIIFIIIIYSFFLKGTFSDSYEDGKNFLEKKDYISSVLSIHKYIDINEGKTECEVFFTLSEVILQLQSEKSANQYMNVGKLCNAYKAEEKDKIINILQILNLEDYNDFKDSYSAYLYANYIMINYGDTNIEYLKNNLYFDDYTQEINGEIEYSFLGKAHLVLSKYYLEKKDISNYISHYLQYIDLYDRSFELYNEFFFTLISLDDISPYKAQLIQYSGEEYTIFIEKYNLFIHQKWNNGNIDQHLFVLIMDYYFKNKNYIESHRNSVTFFEKHILKDLKYLVEMHNSHQLTFSGELKKVFDENQHLYPHLILNDRLLGYLPLGIILFLFIFIIFIYKKRRNN